MLMRNPGSFDQPAVQPGASDAPAACVTCSTASPSRPPITEEGR